MGIETALIAGAAATAGSALLDNKNAKKSIDSQNAQRQASQDFIERMQTQARQDVFKLFPSAQESRNLGNQASFNLFKQTIPMQAQAMRAGNVGAQQMVAQGLPQIQNAILGGPVNTNFQPMTITTNESLGGLQMPQFGAVSRQPSGLPAGAYKWPV